MYYFIFDGEQQGPYDVDQIGRLNINSATLVWQEGLSEWKEAHEVEELKKFLISTPPPVPKEVFEFSKVSTLNVNLGLRKNHFKKKSGSYFNSEKIRIRFAKELKTNFKIAVFSLFGGVVAALVYGLYIYHDSYSTYIERKEDYQSKVVEYEDILKNIENYDFNSYSEAVGKESAAFVTDLNIQKELYQIEENRIAKINEIEEEKFEKNRTKVPLEERIGRGIFFSTYTPIVISNNEAYNHYYKYLEAKDSLSHQAYLLNKDITYETYTNNYNTYSRYSQAEYNFNNFFSNNDEDILLLLPQISVILFFLLVLFRYLFYFIQWIRITSEDA
ncbi:DUF4339 domain-containing protein [Pontibacter sp. HSC-36F09]|uniref:DUF4339 domain-containing protein n=1 Tax=Pontibacter sp. HSC-36F09 TaxID=2910966 RepID=UPI00209FCB4B|nr:DUF4339 domain-containing protein [Pontibacter sp. HSC-36F09]MCP2042665.1 uncharacterized protein YxeA [Pontibacter sp. HSC-36F09]